MISRGAVAVIAMVLTVQPTVAQDALRGPTGERTVTVDNYVRAESDLQFRAYAAIAGGVGRLNHLREPYSVDNQTTVRGNRDTFYSMGVFDLSTPVTIRKPESSDRFQSMMLINQDHSIPPAEHGPGTFTLTQESMGTRYVMVVFRTFADPGDPADVRAAHALQDAIRIEQADRGSLELPNWDEASLIELRSHIMALASTSTDTSGFMGEVGTIDPIKHLLGAAYGWGGNPKEAAIYITGVPDENNGRTPYQLHVADDVPVDGFWSVTVYDRDGWMVKNSLDRYSFNNVTAETNADGSITINFGGDPDQMNYIPIMDGWNYTVRLYQPREEILNGSYDFPEPVVAR